MEDVLFECNFVSDDKLSKEIYVTLILRRPMTILLAVLYAGLAVLCVSKMLWFLNRTGSIPSAVWFALAIAVLIPVYYFVAYRRVLKNRVVQMNELYGDRRPEVTVSVTENTLRYVDTTRVDAIELPLSAIKKVYETKNTLILYSHSKMVFSFNKACFTRGTPEELKRFLKEKGVR